MAVNVGTLGLAYIWFGQAVFKKMKCWSVQEGTIWNKQAQSLRRNDGGNPFSGQTVAFFWKNWISISIVVCYQFDKCRNKSKIIAQFMDILCASILRTIMSCSSFFWLSLTGKLWMLSLLVRAIDQDQAIYGTPILLFREYQLQSRSEVPMMLQWSALSTEYELVISCLMYRIHDRRSFSGPSVWLQPLEMPNYESYRCDHYATDIAVNCHSHWVSFHIFAVFAMNITIHHCRSFFYLIYFG